MLIDQFGRKITYLRISVTDRCNLRCVYCMPAEGIDWQPHENIMRFEEILEVIRIAAENGVSSIRITGGEPLVRRGIAQLIKRISQIKAVEDISLTTNGVLLKEMAEELANSGLRRINISLDTLQEDRFKQITRIGQFEQVWQGILAAERVGMGPIKINTVVVRGVNEDEICDIAQLTLDKPWHVRFIEFMQFNNVNGMSELLGNKNDQYYSVKEMKTVLEPYGLNRVASTFGAGPSKLYKLDNAKGFIGFIAPVGDHFCQQCNRLRLTADGNLRPCLLSDIEIPVLPALRNGEPVLPYLQKAVKYKPLSHQLADKPVPFTRCMTQIGG